MKKHEENDSEKKLIRYNIYNAPILSIYLCLISF